MLQGNLLTASESPKTSNETVFELKKSGVPSTCFSVTVDFSPLQQPDNQNIHTQNSIPFIRSVPIFNSDNKYFTPSFILEADKNKYLQNQLIYKQLFEQKIHQIDQQSSQMYLPRPSKTNSFCCVCKMIFDDYLTHVNLPLHKTFMQKSEFHAEINSLCGKFVLPEQKASKKKAAKKVAKTKTVKKQRKSDSKSRKVQIDSISTSRGHSSNDEMIEGVNC